MPGVGGTWEAEAWMKATGSDVDGGKDRARLDGSRFQGKEEGAPGKEAKKEQLVRQAAGRGGSPGPAWLGALREGLAAGLLGQPRDYRKVGGCSLTTGAPGVEAGWLNGS